MRVDNTYINQIVPACKQLKTLLKSEKNPWLQFFCRTFIPNKLFFVPHAKLQKYDRNDSSGGVKILDFFNCKISISRQCECSEQRLFWSENIFFSLKNDQKLDLKNRIALRSQIFPHLSPFTMCADSLSPKASF